jgi:hypothetical protein
MITIIMMEISITMEYMLTILTIGIRKYLIMKPKLLVITTVIQILFSAQILQAVQTLIMRKLKTN